MSLFERERREGREAAGNISSSMLLFERGERGGRWLVTSGGEKR
jgi:hypothetical protein